MAFVLFCACMGYSCAMNVMQSTFSKNPILRWIPALLMMAAIFLFSASPSTDVQRDWWDPIIYKGGHVIGYAMLTLSLWRGFDFRVDKRWLLWLLAVGYAVTDEYHQSFVPGRHPAVFDVLVYDNAGALFALWMTRILMKRKQPIPEELVVKTETLTANG